MANFTDRSINGLTWRNAQTWRNAFTWRGIKLTSFTDRSAN